MTHAALLDFLATEHDWSRLGDRRVGGRPARRAAGPVPQHRLVPAGRTSEADGAALVARWREMGPWVDRRTSTTRTALARGLGRRTPSSGVWSPSWTTCSAARSPPGRSSTRPGRRPPTGPRRPVLDTRPTSRPRSSKGFRPASRALSGVPRRRARAGGPRRRPSRAERGARRRRGLRSSRPRPHDARPHAATRSTGSASRRSSGSTPSFGSSATDSWARADLSRRSSLALRTDPGPPLRRAGRGVRASPSRRSPAPTARSADWFGRLPRTRVRRRRDGRARGEALDDRLLPPAGGRRQPPGQLLHQHLRAEDPAALRGRGARLPRGGAGPPPPDRDRPGAR